MISNIHIWIFTKEFFCDMCCLLVKFFVIVICIVIRNVEESCKYWHFFKKFHLLILEISGNNTSDRMFQKPFHDKYPSMVIYLSSSQSWESTTYYLYQIGIRQICSSIALFCFMYICIVFLEGTKNRESGYAYTETHDYVS